MINLGFDFLLYCCLVGTEEVHSKTSFYLKFVINTNLTYVFNENKILPSNIGHLQNQTITSVDATHNAKAMKHFNIFILLTVFNSILASSFQTSVIVKLVVPV